MNVLIKIEEETGKKPKDMAEILGITKSYYSMLRNDVRPISKEIALKIHEAFDVPLEEIFFGLAVNAGLTNPTGTDC